MIYNGEINQLPNIGENCTALFPLTDREREIPLTDFKYRSLVKTYMPDYEVLRAAFLHGTTHITSSARAEKKER